MDRRLVGLFEVGWLLMTSFLQGFASMLFWIALVVAFIFLLTWLFPKGPTEPAFYGGMMAAVAFIVLLIAVLFAFATAGKAL